MEYEILKQHHDALKSENDSLKGVLEHERAEKIAITHLSSEHWKMAVNANTQLIKFETQINKLQSLVAQKDVEIERLKDQVKSLESLSIPKENQE